jgi:hypothetical protein
MAPKSHARTSLDHGNFFSFIVVMGYLVYDLGFIAGRELPRHGLLYVASLLKQGTSEHGTAEEASCNGQPGSTTWSR